MAEVQASSANVSNKPIILVLDKFDDKALSTLREESRNLGLFQPKQDDVRKEAPGNFDIVFADDPKRDEYLQKATLLLIQSTSNLDASAIEKLGSSVKYIVKQGLDVDNIDLAAASKKNIQVYNAPGTNSASVAELTIGLALDVARRITEIDRHTRKGGEKAAATNFIGKSLHQKTIGIIGMGAVGIEVARKWVGFTSGSVIGFDTEAVPEAWTKEIKEPQFTRSNDIEQLLKDADFVSIHVPLTDATRNLLDERRLGLIKDGAIILNTAQAGIIDEAALQKALDSGRVFGAGLDANYSEKLLSHPRVVITPHVGTATEENQAKNDVVAVDLAVSLIEGRREQVPAALNARV
jgi:D-3-phosphoglycerate dehydrogenase